MHMRVGVCRCQSAHAEVRGQLARVSSGLPLCLASVYVNLTGAGFVWEEVRECLRQDWL